MGIFICHVGGCYLNYALCVLIGCSRMVAVVSCAICVCVSLMYSFTSRLSGGLSRAQMYVCVKHEDSEVNFLHLFTDCFMCVCSDD